MTKHLLGMLLAVLVVAPEALADGSTMNLAIEVDFPSSNDGVVNTTSAVKWYAFDAPENYQIDWQVTHTAGSDDLKVSIFAEVDPTATPDPERVEYLVTGLASEQAVEGTFWSNSLARYLIGIEQGPEGLSGENSFTVALFIGTPGDPRMARVILLEEPASPAAGGYGSTEFRVDVLVYQESEPGFVWQPFGGATVTVVYSKSELTGDGFVYGTDSAIVELTDGVGTFDWPFTLSGLQSFTVVAPDEEFESAASDPVQVAAGVPFAAYVNRDKGGPLVVRERDPEDPLYQFGEEGASLGRETIWVSILDEFGNQVGTGESDSIEVSLELDLEDLADTDFEIEVVPLEQEDSLLGDNAPEGSIHEVEGESEAFRPSGADPTALLLNALCQVSPPSSTQVGGFYGVSSGVYQVSFGLSATTPNQPQSGNMPFTFVVGYTDGVDFVPLHVYLFSGTTGSSAATAAATASLGQGAPAGPDPGEAAKIANLKGPYPTLVEYNYAFGPGSNWGTVMHLENQPSRWDLLAWGSVVGWPGRTEVLFLDETRNGNGMEPGSPGFRDSRLAQHMNGHLSHLGLGTTGTLLGNMDDEIRYLFRKESLVNEDPLHRRRGWELKAYWDKEDKDMGDPLVYPTVHWDGEIHAMHYAKALLVQQFVGVLEHHGASASFGMKCWSTGGSFVNESVSVVCGVTHDSAVKVGGVTIGAGVSLGGPSVAAGVSLILTGVENKYSDHKAKPDHQFVFAGSGERMIVGSTVAYEALSRCWDEDPLGTPSTQPGVHWEMWRLPTTWATTKKLLPGGFGYDEDSPKLFLK